MKETIGQVFSISRDNKPLPFLTISKEISDGIDASIYLGPVK